jgi:hypothetical protein
MWQSRFVLLTDTSLQYSKTNKSSNFSDFYPLDRTHALFTRCTRYDGFVFEIRLSGRQSSYKERASLIFKAANEKDLQEWLRNLSICSKMEKFRTQSPFSSIDQDLKDIALSITNDNGETALHQLALADVTNPHNVSFGKLLVR